MKLEAGQVAVVTGAASGVGLGLATAFVERGLHVVCSDIEPAALAESTDALRSRGGTIVSVRADVSVPDEVMEIRRVALQEFPAIHVVCNNAGVNTMRRPMWDYEILDWQWVLGVNLFGVIHGVNAFVPVLVEQGFGHIVNTASVNGLISRPDMGPYMTSKHAVVGLTECLAQDLATYAPGVGATVFCPGSVHTNIRLAERNRPDRLLGEKGRAGRLGPDFGDEALSPAEAAVLVLDGIERNLLHVVPDQDLRPRIEARIAALLADVPD